MALFALLSLVLFLYMNFGGYIEYQKISTREGKGGQGSRRSQKVENFKPTWNLFALIMPDSLQISSRGVKGPR